MLSASKIAVTEKCRSKSEVKKREKPFIPRLNLNQDYLELKCHERDMQELKQ